MRNLTLLTDLYQLTMMYGYYKHGMHQNRAVFDMFFRNADGLRTHAVMAGNEQLAEYIEGLSFGEEELLYLKSLNLFDDMFLDELAAFRFTGDITAVPEGTIVFPGEPLIRVDAPIFEAQLIESAVLNIINHQTLIATKASRVVQAAKGDRVLEFGLRRAQGPDAGIYGSRASVVGGCNSTSNVLAGKMFGIPVSGTHAHSWVMSFPDELSAFRAYAKNFPDACLLLVDTYNTLKSGVPNAITVFRELREQGHEPTGIRLDSGDLAFLSREARRMLDDAGFKNVNICASGDLDETLIRDLKQQGASIDIWGVGTRLITSEDAPALGGVYKLSAEYKGDAIIPKIKISENPAKITNPGLKKLLRIYDKESGMAIADLIALDHEVFDEDQPLSIFDPVDTWKKMTLTNYRICELQAPLFKFGKRIAAQYPIMEIRDYHLRELKTFWDQYLRLRNPHVYKVDLSHELWALKQEMLLSYGN